MSKKSYPIVVVDWEDSCHQTGYWDATKAKAGNDLHTPLICRDVGFLLRHNRKSVVIAQSYFPTEDDLRQLQIIPRKMVRRIIRLKEK